MDNKTGNTYEYLIDQRDIDFTGYASYVAILNYLLEAAGEDADLNGFGVRDLNQENTSWVLSRMAVEFDGRPLQGETIEVRTWVNEVHRMGTIRCMDITNASSGCPIARAVTQWAVIDIARRSAVDISAHTDWPSRVTGEPCPIERPKRIRSVNPVKISSHTASYSDIDFNRHVNAVRYIGWILDIVPLANINDRHLWRLDVNFLHESVYGDVLEVGLEEKGPAESAFSIVSGDHPVCMASISWR